MRKKHLLAVLLSALVLGTASAATAAAADGVYGDANCDGNVDMSDAVLIMQALANPGKYGINGTDAKHITQKGIDLADVCENGNGLTSNDALSIQNYLLGNIKNLPESYKEGSASTTTTVKPEQTTTTTTKPVDTVPQEDVNTVIHLNGSSITVEGKYATANGSKVTISHSGTYTIDGTLNDGQIYVEVPDEKADPDTVKLVFNGVNITGKSAPAVLIKNADKTSITVADGTENIISDGTNAYSGDELESAVLEAKDDLTIKGGDNGTGKLTINANIQPAIVCNNDLKLTGGVLSINTLNESPDVTPDAVKGKGSVTVKGGSIDIVSKGDGIKSSKGEVVIEGGTLVIKASKDAIQAETDITISGGDIAAFGDKGLTAVGNVNITGGNVLVTAKDNQCENIKSTEQATMVLDFTKEWAKNNPIAVTDSSNKVILEQNPPKKYKYAIVSSPDIASGDFKVFAGGIKMKHSSGNTFKAGKPAKYTDVNNDMENEEQLYEGLFSQAVIHKIDVQMNESTWQNMMNNASKEEWTPCDVTIDGETIKNVAIRTKGNSSLMMAQNGKYSLRLKLDKYDKTNNYHGLTEFCMNNMLSDASCLRDILCYNAMYEVDGVAPHAAHTDMYLNGKLYSFYLLAEQPGDTLAERYGVDDDTVLYKATERNGGGGGFGFGGDGYCSFTERMPLDNFDVKFGVDDNFSHIQDIKTAINQLSSTNYKFIEDVIDVPSFLKGFAVNSIFCNYDSYNGSLAHNYYLIYTNGKAYFVGWDYNLAMGNFMGGADSVNSDITTSLYQSTVTDRPLAKLLQVPEYYDMYVGYVKEILNLYSNPEQYISNYAKNIRSHVQADPRFEFTIDQFDSNTSRSANGLQTSGGGQQQGGWNMGGQQQGGWNMGGQQQGGQQQGGWDMGQQQGGQQQGGWDMGQQQGGWNMGGQQQGGQQQGGWDMGQQQGGWNMGGFQMNSDEPQDGDVTVVGDEWAFQGNFGGGGMQWGGGGGGFGGGWGGFGGGGGMFGGGNISVVDFLEARFSIIRSALRM